MELNNQEAKQLRKDFPIFKNNPRLAYLDNAATTQKPKKVIDAITMFYNKDYSNIGRGVYSLSERATELYEESRKIVAGFLNSKPEEIVYTKGTTESINLLSYVLPSTLPKSKKEIVLTEMEHHSNLVPWQQLAKRNKMKLKFIKIKKGTLELDLEDAKKKITDKTAIVSLTHVSNVLGTINEVKDIVKIAKLKKAITIVDAAQSIAHVKVDVKSLGCDFLAFSGHKIFASTGIGVLYGRRELLEKLPPFNFGGGAIRKVAPEDSEFADSPQKFEAGTPNIEGAISLGAAISYLQKIGIESIEAWEKKLLSYAIARLKDIPNIEIYSSAKKSSGILSFNLKGIPPHDVASLLNDYGIAIRAGHHCAMPLMKTLGVPGTCRISFAFYNTFEDIEKLFKALIKIQERFE